MIFISNSFHQAFSEDIGRTSGKNNNQKIELLQREKMD